MILIINNYPHKSYKNFEKLIKIIESTKNKFTIISTLNQLNNFEEIPKNIIFTGSSYRATDSKRSFLTIVATLKFINVPKMYICFSMEVLCMYLGAQIHFLDNKITGQVTILPSTSNILNNKENVVCVFHKGYIEKTDKAITKYITSVHNNMVYSLEVPMLNAIGFQFHPEGSISTQYIFDNFFQKQKT
jgi:anthranilate/para-aminobenzoate synthase component II